MTLVIFEVKLSLGWNRIDAVQTYQAGLRFFKN